MRVLQVLALVVLAVGLWSLVIRRPPLTRPRPRPSVVLITVDTLRPDRLGCYGYPITKTPAIDRLAREGTLFETAYCDIPWTTGSMASVMTGTYGTQHGVQLPNQRLRPEAVTLAEILAASGYQTGAVIGSFPLDSVYGLDQGFETYDDEFSLPIFAVAGQPVEHVESRLDEDDQKQAEFITKKLLNDAYRPDEAVTDAAIRWLDHTRDGRSFFLWVHYFGPHEKLRGDTGLVTQEPEIVATYDLDVRAADRAVGRLVDHLRSRALLDSTMVVFHADHGQSLGEHGYVGHSMDLYDASVRVPLIIRYPDRFWPHARRQDVVRNVDILPTILDVCHVPSTGRFVGRSLARAADHRPAGVRRPEVAYFDTQVPTIVFGVTTVAGMGKVLGPVRMAGLRTAEWKLITGRVVGRCSRAERAGRNEYASHYLVHPVEVEEERCRAIETTELYAAASREEPGLNVAAAHPELTAALKDVLASLSSGGPALHEEFTLSPEQQRKLRSLGYLR